ncbi:MotA/TolQ/ExbB proton channel family protein [Planctomyces sp. SH-PL62]|uniref:MotA/TolQ/ExbB proton channel family protein n=1 Tax=Planctomyces sp. SH-PL62 TaxID=1636152 RepID=UPI00078DDF06|nr:MotA/TolQ/ExbB proton channel family protein [Planctomyces sp. SH-PL62]AMV40349.1 Biopolymer transport protein ExbB [Planctomyces sp. SH-PL62]
MTESRRGRVWAIASFLGIWLLAISWSLSPSTATAQESEPAAVATASTGGEQLAGDDGGESFLRWMIRASGLIGVLIAVMSFYLVALIVWMSIHYRTSAAAPRFLVRETRELLDQRRYGDAYNRLAADRSLFARVLAAGVQKLPAGILPARRAMDMANEDATMEMEHRTTYLATVGTLGPMIGLVGTVYGMIKAFRVIATKGTAPQASLLAEGISTALFATLEGIAISIPAIYFYAFFRNRIARMSLEAEKAAEPLLELFAPGVKPETSATPNPAPATPAGPGSHPHPFALNAALAASGGVAPRSALPPAHPE